MFKHVLELLGIRLDAKYTAALEQQLEAVKSRTYDIQYPELKARKFAPSGNTAGPGADSIAYQQWDLYGMAEIIANYADDLPMVDAKAEKFTSPIHSVGVGYQYSIHDLRRSSMAGNKLDAKRASAARRATELRIDDIAATGDAKGKLKGMLNHPNVTVLTATTDGSSTRWVGGRTTPKAADLIKKDMHDAITSIWTTTKQVYSPDTIILSTTEYGHISQQQVGTENQSTILSTFVANNPNVKEVDFWYKLDLADAAGTGPRMVVYKRDPEVLELEIPQEFEQLPPQAVNLAFKIPCHARIGGVIIYYPLALVYQDGI